MRITMAIKKSRVDKEVAYGDAIKIIPDDYHSALFWHLMNESAYVQEIPLASISYRRKIILHCATHFFVNVMEKSQWRAIKSQGMETFLKNFILSLNFFIYENLNLKKLRNLRKFPSHVQFQRRRARIYLF